MQNIYNSFLKPNGACDIGLGNLHPLMEVRLGSSLLLLQTCIQMEDFVMDILFYCMFPQYASSIGLNLGSLSHDVSKSVCRRESVGVLDSTPTMSVQGLEAQETSSLSFSSYSIIEVEEKDSSRREAS
jgi:hypothetical protein